MPRDQHQEQTIVQAKKKKEREREREREKHSAFPKLWRLMFNPVASTQSEDVRCAVSVKCTLNFKYFIQKTKNVKHLFNSFLY